VAVAAGGGAAASGVVVGSGGSTGSSVGVGAGVGSKLHDAITMLAISTANNKPHLPLVRLIIASFSHRDERLETGTRSINL
jgi:hypothetical protein